MSVPETASSRAQVSTHRRQQFKYVSIFIQILVSIISFSLPVTWGLARSTVPINGMGNLSPVESLLLGSRLEGIKTGIENKYSSCSETRTFIFPGAGGVDDLVEELQACKPNSMIIDWKEYRGSILTASFDSEAVGEAIAELVLNNMGSRDDETHSIQFIGISVGAFAANAAATVVHRYLTENNQSAGICNVHLVLLDPFCGRGVFGPNYGRDNFGKYATTALQILNTDDPVPSTNDVLPLCYCIDVTDAPEKESFVPLPGDSMHSWPLAYYARHYSEGMDLSESETPILPRGKVKIVS